MPQIGEQVFYRNGANGFPQKGFIVGEMLREDRMEAKRLSGPTPDPETGEK